MPPCQHCTVPVQHAVGAVRPTVGGDSLLDGFGSRSGVPVERCLAALREFHVWADWVWRRNRDRLLRRALDEGLPVEEVAAALQTTVGGARDLLERAARDRPVEDLHLPGSFRAAGGS